ncbi:MAG: hypothetical protein HN875_02120 [Candidatus Nitrosopelagicus sp.]|jgi:hypothetical protein|nr:hypothetical protein [Candidatus Nitrosopelagicus sp.]
MKLIENPITECITNHIFKLDVQRLAKLNAMGQHPIMWSNDILFWIGDFENSEYVTKRELQGFYYVDTILYADSPLIDQAKWNGYSSEVLDMTGHRFFDELTKELKKIV